MKIFNTVGAGVMVIVTLISIGFAVYYYQKPAEKIVIPSEAKKLASIEVQSAVKKIKGSGGVERAILEDKKNLIKTITELDTSSRDSVRILVKKLGIAEKQLQHYVGYTAKIENSLARAARINDSTYRHSNPNISIDFVMKNALGDVSVRDSSYFKYKYQAKINYAEYNSKGFLGFGKKDYIEVWLDDPNATIQGMQRFRIEPKKDNFGVNVGASVLLLEDKPLVGPSVDVRLGRSTFTGEYLRNFSDKKWTPSFRYKFNLLEL